jgi:adenylate cyclase
VSEQSPEQRLQSWLTTYDPADGEPGRLLSRFVEGLRLLGIPICRASLWLPTAHPELWGTQVVWSESGSEVMARAHDVTQTSTFRNSPGEAVHAARHSLRFRLDVDPKELPYPMLRELQAEGMTDYLIIPFHTDHAYEQPWITFATRAKVGFSDIDAQNLETFCVAMGWKTRVVIAEHATRSLLRVYLGPNAAKRVLEGEFRRGSGQQVQSVIWFCDLRGFTTLGDSMPASELVALLDRYFEFVAGPIEDQGGEILKFVGDAVLAIFPSTAGVRSAAERALGAARLALAALSDWSEKAAASGHPELHMGISLHVGEVFYGNVGGRSRLDFTVIGAAVNEAARVESLCKEVGVPLLATRSFAEAFGVERLQGVGKRRLRGVKNEQELFTLPEIAPRPAEPL